VDAATLDEKARQGFLVATVVADTGPKHPHKSAENPKARRIVRSVQAGDWTPLP
jgi:hypothetical protein